MNSAADERRVLAGATRGAMRRAGGAVELAPGCAEALARACRMGVPLSVVSVSWSAGFVRAALERGLAGVPGGSGDVRCPHVTANELSYGADGVCAGGSLR